ncbi:hypothetical protein [Aurantiacibacter hainanensis]|uniref:hypothetical protein n=1 Tax=Aurantiacibacter hainanensis TaxID=3076114 RepID=UPI0030C715AD
MPVQLFAAAPLGGNSLQMEGDRISRALARIDAASARIEAAVARRQPASAPSDPDLQARYDRLRDEAKGALAEVDALIESLSS